MLEFFLISSTSFSLSQPNPFHIKAVQRGLEETLILENYKEEAIVWPKWSPEPVGLRVSFDYGFKVDYPINSGSFGLDFGEKFVIYPARHRDDKGEYLKQDVSHQERTRLVVDFYPSFMQTYLTDLSGLEMPPRICFNEAVPPASFANDSIKATPWLFHLSESSFAGFLLTLGYSFFDPKFNIDASDRLNTLIKTNRTVTKDPNFLPSLFKSFQAREARPGFVSCPEKLFEGVACFCKV